MKIMFFLRTSKNVLVLISEEGYRRKSVLRGLVKNTL